MKEHIEQAKKALAIIKSVNEQLVMLHKKHLKAMNKI